MAETYQLVSQSQTNELNPAGTGFIQVWNVVAKVTSGPAKDTLVTLQFPESEHTAQVVGKAFADKIATLSEIAALGSK